jgi:hypothetical protein
MAKTLVLFPTKSIQQVNVKFSVDYGRVGDILAAFRNVNPIPRYETIYLRR